MSDEAKQKFEAGLNDAETWLYEGDGYDATKSQYAQRLKDVRNIGDAAELRRKADRERPSLVAELQAKVEALKTFCNSTSEEHAHIGDDDRGTVRDAASKASGGSSSRSRSRGVWNSARTPSCCRATSRTSSTTSTRRRGPSSRSQAAPPKPAPPPPADAPPAEAKEEDGDAKMDDAAAAPEDAAAAAPRTPRCPTRPRPGTHHTLAAAARPPFGYTPHSAGPRRRKS